jgi:hypothetical protein
MKQKDLIRWPCRGLSDRTRPVQVHCLLVTLVFVSRGSKGLRGSDLHKTAPDRNSDCVRPVVRLKFVHEILDVEVDGCLSDG